MHIVFLTHEYPRKGFVHGGIGSVVHALAHALKNKGHSVSVVGTGQYEDSTQDDNGIAIHRLKCSNWIIASFYPNSQSILKKLEEINAKNKIDVIEGPELDFAFFPKKYFCKKVIRMHGGHNFFSTTLGKKPKIWRSFQEKLSFKKADALIAVSDYVGKTTLALLKDNRPYTRIYNLVDLTKFEKLSGEMYEKDMILFIGTVVEKKGVKELVQSMQKVVQYFPNAQLNIVGRDSIDPLTKKSYTQTLEKMIPQEIKSNIHFIGVVPHTDVPKWLDKAEICAYPSHMEAQGIVVVEAMAKGKPVIFSQTGPGKEMIEHNVNGLLCDPYDSIDIADKIISLLQDKEYAKQMGENAKVAINEKFSMDDIIKENINFYQSLLER